MQGADCIEISICLFMSLQTKFQQQIVPELVKELKLSNFLAAPRVEKVIVAMGLGEAVKDKSQIEKASQDLALITGQKPLITKARISVASFKVRQGMPLGIKVTLRRKRMYDFLEKLFTMVVPRLRDFRGLDPRKFDGQGNYNLGFKEQIVFPEIDYAKIDRIRGLEVTIVTSTKDDSAAKLLLSKLGMRFMKNN